MTLYSSQFSAGNTGGAGTVALFTVPAGHRYVIRDIRLVSQSGGATTAKLSISALADFFPVASAAALSAFETTGRITINAGQTVNLVVASGGWHWVVSGYDLLT